MYPKAQILPTLLHDQADVLNVLQQCINISLALFAVLTYGSHLLSRCEVAMW